MRRSQDLRNELDITMAFCGHRDIRNVTKDILLPGTFPAGSVSRLP
jgi:L-lactate dehydrogenase (cytochrome)